MAQGAVKTPFPIFQTARRYLLFDIEIITYIRREHHICGVLVGNIPQAAQQTVFSGIPLELMPEEARLLIDQGIAFIVDDAKAHDRMLAGLETQTKQKYLADLEQNGLEAAQSMQSQAVENKKAFFKKSGTPVRDLPTGVVEPFQVTPTTSYPPLEMVEPLKKKFPEVSASYPVFRHLHENGYFMAPGLRFGCQYVAYPGDPLRYHSHFLVTGHDWDEEIDLLDVVGGGRLGTGVKKGFMIGGARAEEQDEEQDEVRVFSFEWAAM
jgi:tRNA-splicing endonuclease subunit Sen34